MDIGDSGGPWAHAYCAILYNLRVFSIRLKDPLAHRPVRLFLCVSVTNIKNFASLMKYSRWTMCEILIAKNTWIFGNFHLFVFHSIFEDEDKQFKNRFLSR